MTDSTNSNQVNKILGSQNLENFQDSKMNLFQTGTFKWDSKDKGIALGAFFYGNILTQIIGGYAATKYGGNIVTKNITSNLGYKLN